MGADTLTEQGRGTGQENQAEWPSGYPYPPFCRVFGWLVSRGGWIRLDDLQTSLGHISEYKAKRLLQSHGINVHRCDWHGTELDCLQYRDARRVMAAVRKREPP